jgi:small conductance mechanosensitive channel
MLVNHSLYGAVRVNVPVGIAYKERIAEARDVLLPAARSVAGVMETPAPQVVVCDLGDSSVNLEVRVWTDDPAHERRLLFEVLEASKTALDSAGIQIPFPHLQLLVEGVSDRVWAGAARLPQLQGRAG